MAAVQNLLVKIGADISGLTRGMRDATSQITNMQSQLNQSSQALKKVGAIATGTGIAVAAGLGGMVKTAANFESAMSRVGAISGANADELARLTEAARKAGESTAWSASQSAEALQYLALAGWKTEEMIAGLPGMLNLASAGALDLATAADITSDMMSMFGIEASKAGYVADVFAKASTSANTDVAQLGEALKYLGANANALGWDIEQSSAAIMALADSGVKGSMAGQAFATSLGRLAKPTAKMETLMKKLGLSFFDSEGNMKSMPNVIKELETGMKGMNAQQKSAALTTLFGAEAFKHWQILMNRGSTDLENMTQALRDSGGTAEEVADKQLDNLNGQLTLLKSAFEGASISLGSALLPALSAITSVVQQAVDWFNGLNEKTKSMIAIISALGAGLLIFGGLFLMIVGSIPSMVIGFGMLGTALSALGGVFSAILSPIGLVIAAIAGIGIGLKAAYENVEWFRNGVDTAFAFIKDSISLAINFINEQLTKLREFWSENSDSILSKAQEIWTAILNVINEVLSTVWGFVQDILGKIQEFWQNHGDFITDIASTVWGAIKSVIEGTLSSIKDNIESALGIIKGIFEAVWPIISGVVTIAWGLIKTTVQNSIDFVYGIIDTVMNLLKGDWEGAWESIKETAKSIWNNIEKFFKDVDLVEIGKNIIKGLIKGISSMAREVRETVESIASSISDAVTGFFDMHSPSRLTRGQGRNIGKGLELGLADSLNGLIKMSEKVSEAVSASIDMSYDAPNVASRAFAFTHALENENQRPSVVNMTVNQQLPEDVSPVKERREQNRLMRNLALEMGVL